MMKCLTLGVWIVTCYAVSPVAADVVILHDGSSYSGRLSPEKIMFTGQNGVGFTFPLSDVQSLVFNAAADTITLNDGRTYSGHYAGGKVLNLSGAEGVAYNFPVSDIVSVVLTARAHRAERGPGQNANQNRAAKVIAEGAQITITTNERIDSRSAEQGRLYAATISSDVADTQGAVVIHSGAPAKLIVRNSASRGQGSPPELVLDLFSVSAGGQQYRTVSTNVVERGRDSVGANQRTLEYAGGGGGLGALLGGVFGGGRGAGIGALAGAGGGALTQFFTRGSQVAVPAEATLTFHLDRTLVLRLMANGDSANSN